MSPQDRSDYMGALVVWALLIFAALILLFTTPQ